MERYEFVNSYAPCGRGPLTVAAVIVSTLTAVALLASPAWAEATPSAAAATTVGTDEPTPRRSPEETKPSAAAEPTVTEAPDSTNPPPEPDPTTPPPDPTPPPGPDPSTPPPDSPPPPEPTPASPRPSNKPPRGGDTEPQPGAGTAENGGGPQAPRADSGPSLPVTGDSVAPLVGTAGVALVAGVGLLLAGRRKTPPMSHLRINCDSKE
ncbi:LPXTG cell wall anchor domain-containing protein [Micromonospora rubida]|uniref:LPXTG cell wall anchor domain-containing protein n=1 Tax=Micromonospora rubida TaxID=2697657 RepID=A0ABW7SXC6_9ACTN